MPDFKLHLYRFWINISTALLVLLFLYAALVKYGDLTLFKHELSLQPFPLWLNEILFVLIPAFELLIVLLLLSQNTKLIGFISAFIILVAFTIYIIFILAGFWNHVPCACGGIISWLGWEPHLWFNIFFIATSGIGIYFSLKERRLVFN